MMNTLEVYHQTGVKCGEAQRKKDQGTVSHLMDWFHKAVRMEGEMSKKLASDTFNKGYREGTGYSQQQKPQYFREKVGFDGKYVDDMESGVAVKKLHGLDEDCGINQQRPMVMYQDFTRRLIYGLGIQDKSSYVKAEKIIKDFLPTFSEYFPDNNLKEETGTGAVAGYATPYAFSKKKEGSSRAIASAKKYGTVVKSISEKKK